MKTAIVLLASVASTADAIVCSANGVYNETCDVAVNNCYASYKDNTTWQGCDYLEPHCVGNSPYDCSSYDVNSDCLATRGCSWIDTRKQNYYADLMPSNSTCCEDSSTGALYAISPTDFDGVLIDDSWFSTNCANPMPCEGT